MFRKKICDHDEELLASSPTPSWRTAPCQPCATAYSIYSQLPSTWRPFLQPQPEDASCRGDRTFLPRL